MCFETKLLKTIASILNCLILCLSRRKFQTKSNIWMGSGVETIANKETLEKKLINGFWWNERCLRRLLQHAFENKWTHFKVYWRCLWDYARLVCLSFNKLIRILTMFLQNNSLHCFLQSFQFTLVIQTIMFCCPILLVAWHNYFWFEYSNLIRNAYFLFSVKKFSLRVIFRIAKNVYYKSSASILKFITLVPRGASTIFAKLALE